MIWFYNFTSMYFTFLISDYISTKYKLKFLHACAVSFLFIVLFQELIMPVKGQIFTLEILSAVFVATLLSGMTVDRIIEGENQN